jgi:hypothetical protein
MFPFLLFLSNISTAEGGIRTFDQVGGVIPESKIEEMRVGEKVSERKNRKSK